VRRGEWHRVTMLEPAQLLHITPGPSGDYRPLWQANRFRCPRPAVPDCLQRVSTTRQWTASEAGSRAAACYSIAGVDFRARSGRSRRAITAPHPKRPRNRCAPPLDRAADCPQPRGLDTARRGKAVHASVVLPTWRAPSIATTGKLRAAAWTVGETIRSNMTCILDDALPIHEPGRNREPTDAGRLTR
jgi:hypothetical protein